MWDYYDEPEGFEPPDYFEKINEVIQEEVDSQVGIVKESNLRLNAQINEIRNENREIKKELAKTQKEIETIKDENNAFLNVREIVNEENLESVVSSFGLKKQGIGYGMKEKNLYYRLVLEYYNEKDKLFSIFKAFGLDYIANLKNFKLPRDYSKEELLIILSDLDKRITCTNGEYLANNYQFMSLTDRYFKQLPISKQKVPLQEVLKNKHILEDDCFDYLVKNLSQTKYYGKITHLYGIDQLIKLPKRKLQLIADTITTDVISCKMYENEKNFINRNFKLYHKNEEWLKVAYEKVSSNKYNHFHYGNFPEEYIIDYLKRFDFKKQVDMIKFDNIDESILKKLV